MESKGVPGMVTSTTSYILNEFNILVILEITDIHTAAAMVCDERRATASGAENPASANLSRILVTVSVGSGTVKSGAGALGGGRPNMNSSLGAPGQLAVPTAAAR